MSAMPSCSTVPTPASRVFFGDALDARIVHTLRRAALLKYFIPQHDQVSAISALHQREIRQLFEMDQNSVFYACLQMNSCHGFAEWKCEDFSALLQLTSGYTIAALVNKAVGLEALKLSSDVICYRLNMRLDAAILYIIKNHFPGWSLQKLKDFLTAVYEHDANVVDGAWYGPRYLMPLVPIMLVHPEANQLPYKCLMNVLECSAGYEFQAALTAHRDVISTLASEAFFTKIKYEVFEETLLMATRNGRSHTVEALINSPRYAQFPAAVLDRALIQANRYFRRDIVTLLQTSSRFDKERMTFHPLCSFPLRRDQILLEPTNK